MNSVDPKQFGLSSRTYLIENKNTISIIIDRKSRIIMKDGKKILDQANAIQKIKKKAITLLTSTPVCGKTKIFLSENDIKIKSLV
tara:strand:+ start:447 stop:701 length:255 start_codon:yes stop_codon:yes gene_type:complete